MLDTLSEDADFGLIVSYQDKELGRWEQVIRSFGDN
jgi:hypothetical protein